MKKKLIQWMLGLTVGCVVIVVLMQLQFLPYSQSHFRQIEAVKLRMFVREWEMMGRPADYVRTNKSGRKVFLFDKELNFGGTNIHGFMRMEGGTLTEGGYLVATTNSVVLVR
jgi:hypothetical protein